jgi:hypothetical protein
MYQIWCKFSLHSSFAKRKKLIGFLSLPLNYIVMIWYERRICSIFLFLILSRSTSSWPVSRLSYVIMDKWMGERWIKSKMDFLFLFSLVFRNPCDILWWSFNAFSIHLMLLAVVKDDCQKYEIISVKMKLRLYLNCWWHMLNEKKNAIGVRSFQEFVTPNIYEKFN